jgi:hypothetical protein
LNPPAPARDRLYPEISTRPAGSDPGPASRRPYKFDR